MSQDSSQELLPKPISHLDKFLDTLTNKLHIFIGSLTHASILIYHFKTHLDIPTGIQNCEYAFLGFLAGHAFTYQKYPDKGPNEGGQQ